MTIIHNLATNTEWQQYANCLGCDPALFFPGRGEMTPEVRAVCRECVVQEICLEYALENREVFGVWGGKSERQRREMRRQRRAGKQSEAASFLKSAGL